MTCASCGHDHRDYVYGFTCKDCPCKERPGRAEWEAAVDAAIPVSDAESRRKLAARLVRLADDAAHWNLFNPDDVPIVVDTDIRKDVAKLTTRLVRGGKA